MSLDICVFDTLKREYDEDSCDKGLGSTSIYVGSIGYSKLYERVLSYFGVGNVCQNIMIGPFDWDLSGDVLGVGPGNSFYRWSWLRMRPDFNKQLNLKAFKNKEII